MECLPEEEDGHEGLVADLMWVSPRPSIRTPSMMYMSCRGTPTLFHLRYTRVLVTRSSSKQFGHFALTFFVRDDSFTARALAAIQRSFTTKSYIVGSGVTATFDEHAEVFDANGERITVCGSALEGWVVHALINLRGMWETRRHAGLRLEVSQVQLVLPLVVHPCCGQPVEKIAD